MTENAALIPTVGSVLSLTTASGTVEFTNATETWTEPLVAWAVVVVWSDPALGEYGTDVVAVVIDEDRYPVTLAEYLRERASGTKARIVVPR